jgi:hypothetical protein
MISGKIFTRSIPNAIGTSNNGSKPCLIAKYRKKHATPIIMILPHVRFKNAVC